ncbi:unnamed protein product [Fraxinus pennsylvanica]|uniref:Uncharacterized protein n=1 Tax=Fraxinus pennsylvanica TaxID=56036 RepID=A0AAD1ZX39_9LAMI|nr:unnamed protein product [Fraxinus pennsylvanica]
MGGLILASFMTYAAEHLSVRTFMRGYEDRDAQSTRNICSFSAPDWNHRKLSQNDRASFSWKSRLAISFDSPLPYIALPPMVTRYAETDKGSASTCLASNGWFS